MDKQKAENAVRELLLALDQDINSSDMKGTPRRVAEMLIEQCLPRDAELNSHFEEKSFDGMVTVRDIPFVACCPHHLVFFSGRAHVAYIPKGETILGISKLARLVASCSTGFATQERITDAIAVRLFKEVDCLGDMIVIEAEHGCMTCRGIRSVGSSTVTSVVKGVFRDVPAARQEFLALISKGGPR